MTEPKQDPATPNEPTEFDRFADVARKVFAAPKTEVEKRLEAAEHRRKTKRERKKKQ